MIQLFPRAGSIAGRFYVKPHSWRRRVAKLIIVMIILAVVCMYVGARYRIGHDQQLTLSIPGDRVYVIDLWNHSPERGGRFAFRSEGLEPVFDDGTIMVKFMEGMPGDHVRIGAGDQIIINDKPTSFFGLHQASTLGMSAESFRGEGTLGDGEYWFLAPHKLSIDSRYYGSVNEQRIVGRAYPIY